MYRSLPRSISYRIIGNTIEITRPFNLNKSIDIADITRIRKMTFRDWLRGGAIVNPETIWSLAYGNRIGTDAVVITLRSGFCNKILITPEDTDGFIRQVQLLAGPRLQSSESDRTDYSGLYRYLSFMLLGAAIGLAASMFAGHRPDTAAAARLVGVWESDPKDTDSIKRYDAVTMMFTNDGHLTYTIHAAAKDQIILLTYKVEGHEIVTDQPSAPRIERTRYELVNKNRLVLYYGDHTSRFVRSQ